MWAEDGNCTVDYSNSSVETVCSETEIYNLIQRCHLASYNGFDGEAGLWSSYQRYKETWQSSTQFVAAIGM